jgi:cytochrome c oxidase assembly protein subunit 15
MQGKVFPDGVDWAAARSTLTSDPYLVHFFHRWWAWAVVAVLVVMARKLRRAASGGLPWRFTAPLARR